VRKDRCFDVHQAAPRQLEGKGVPNSEGEHSVAYAVLTLDSWKEPQTSSKFSLVFAATKIHLVFPADRPALNDLHQWIPPRNLVSERFP
jgi:hypothetical protein